MNRSGVFWRPEGRWLRAGAVVGGLAAGGLFLTLFWRTIGAAGPYPAGEPVPGCLSLDVERLTAFVVLSAAFLPGIAGAVVAALRPGLGAALMVPAGLLMVAYGAYTAWSEGQPAVLYHMIGSGMLAAGALASWAHRADREAGGRRDAVQP
ncbi:MAG TPA: hypothetical protein VIO14_00445 [Dehalococcoidia bacterium]